MSTTRPRKQSAVGLYSKRYYEDKVKDNFNTAWKKVKDTAKPGTRIQLINDYTRAAFNAEPEELRVSLEKETEEAYKKEMAEWKAGKHWTPRTSDRAMEDAATILVPFADTISQRFGVYVSLMLCGPMSDGKVGLQRYSKFLMLQSPASKMWPLYDPEGFSAAEKSILSIISQGRL